ncbi:hypothetical protein ACFY7C_24020 [Streptomyces sp. NPDC012769]|uniref:hypothetical protein n=1 Tax=Streptomyces sp. NPDC012769 TaxID=3364848 RepID=UPI003676F8E2
MFEYELHRAHHAELVREAAAQRLSREAVRAAKAARRSSRRQDPEGRVSADPRRFARAA